MFLRILTNSKSIFLCLVICIFQGIESHNVNVKIKQGTIIGTRRSTVFDGNIYFAFYGVPYANPPIRNLRFKNPTKMKKWKHPLDATLEYRGACPQAHIVHKYGLYGFENCLHLNIYTPSIPKPEDKLKPVLVWIHGYAFTSSFSQLHGPDFFIDNDVIVVTVNHRIGAFGFAKLNTTDAHINMGLKDIVIALKWIRRNIAEFGGDRNKLTLMGSGSGATFVSMLLTTKYKKLFSKLILHSGAMFSSALLQKDNVLEINRLQTELKKLGTKDLDRASTKDIVQASNTIYNRKEIIRRQRPLVPFLPIISENNNDTLDLKSPRDYYETAAKNSENKPILMGFNSQECISEVIPFIHNPTLLKSLANSFKFMAPFYDGCSHPHLSESYIKVGNEIKKKYFNGSVSEKSLEMFQKYSSDLHVYPIIKFLKTHFEKFGNKIFVYKFNYEGYFNAFKATSTAGLQTKVKGSSSGDEICYLFNCEPLVDLYKKVNKNELHRDRVFIKKLTDLWSNFIKYGDPTPAGFTGTIWPPVDVNRYNTLLIGKKLRVIEMRNELEMYTFWENIYNTYFTPKVCHREHHDEL